MKRVRIFFQTLLTGVLFIAVFSIFWFIIGALEELVVLTCHIQPIQSLADLNWLSIFIMVFLIVITSRGAKDITFLLMRKLFPDRTLQVCINYLKHISHTGRKAVKYVNSAVDEVCKRDLKDRNEILRSYGIILKPTSDGAYEMDFEE